MPDHSTPAARPAKPEKPYPDFPLTAHPTGRWCKKIRGTLHYFGRWDDPDGALANYNAQAEALHAGRKPRGEAPEGATVKDVANGFLNAKDAKVKTGELKRLTFLDYKEAADLLVTAFGKGRLAADLGPDDFAALRDRMAKRWGPARLKAMIQRVRCVFRHAFESGLLDRPTRYGPDFAPPSRKVLRLHRAAKGKKLFTAAEVRKMLAAANVPLRAMFLLGINCAFGNADCAALPLSAVDLDGAMIDFPRPKTGIPRRCPLWPETVEALRVALAKRPAPRDPAHAGRVFLTKFGRPWAKDANGGAPVQFMTEKLLLALGIKAPDDGKGFYTLRHTFRTVADGAKDQPAADFIMGHEVPHMSSVYREGIADERLRAVADHVRAWLFGAA
jgi:integrase